MNLQVGFMAYRLSGFSDFKGFHSPGLVSFTGSFGSFRGGLL